MRADNTVHLKAAAAARHERTRRKVLDALDRLQRDGTPVTVAGLARTAEVARSWLYTQPDLMARINSQPTTTRPPVNAPASDESWQRRLQLAYQRIKKLTEENAQLRAQLAIAHGQRRAGQITASQTPSTTQSTSS
ncbi:DUF6262 family protein [Mycolicibacterium llatzerense]|uniref:DUF6262 family protein n=1 Tax=Mycolicibacterium llatzerense TaxID=280871 RepID=UPI0008DDF10F|nr:DUF6262 family protein [Mycolicibacterium llatzerense]